MIPLVMEYVMAQKKQMPPKSLSLELGSQYLCEAAFNAPGLPDVLRGLKKPLHLHIIVDSALNILPQEDHAYELRLTLQGFGLEHIPGPHEELQSFYHAKITYGGLFALKGRATEEENEQFMLNEAPGFLFPSARTALLGLIREAGFTVGNIQPIDFRNFWKARQNNGNMVS